jgi:serine/threonine-protein kinase RsbW
MKEGYVVIETLRIPSSFDHVGKVESLIDRVCADLYVNEDYYGNVLIAVTEAVNNAILHGNKRMENLEVDVAVADGGDNFCFSVSDEGPGFDFSNLPDPTAPENILQENGRGIFLMRNLSEEVEFENQGKTVVIYFSK